MSKLPWRNEPPSEKQINYLEKMAGWVNNINTSPKTKGEAADEIDKNVAEMRMRISDELTGAYGDMMW